MTDLSADTSPTETELREEIAALTKANKESRSVDNERRLRELRHVAGIELSSDPGPAPSPSPTTAFAPTSACPK